MATSGGRRSPGQLRTVGDRRQRTFRVVESGLDRVQVARGHQHGSVEDAEHGVAAHRVGLLPQHLLDQVVDDVAVVAGEAGDETAGVLASLSSDSAAS